MTTSQKIEQHDCRDTPTRDKQQESLFKLYVRRNNALRKSQRRLCEELWNEPAREMVVPGTNHRFVPNCHGTAFVIASEPLAQILFESLGEGAASVIEYDGTKSALLKQRYCFIDPAHARGFFSKLKWQSHHTPGTLVVYHGNFDIYTNVPDGAFHSGITLDDGFILHRRCRGGELRIDHEKNMLAQFPRPIRLSRDYYRLPMEPLYDR